MSNSNEIFFSYAWDKQNEEGKSREKIINELYEILKNENYNVIRDKMDLGYKGLISDFMKRIGKGSYIVVAISDKYLKSKYCMFELLEIYRKSNSDMDIFREKVFPIVLDDANIHSGTSILGYINFWKEETEKFEKQIGEVGIKRSVEQ